MLSKQSKEEIFTLGVEYGYKTCSLGTRLHSLVGAHMKLPIWWTANKSLNPTEGITGQIRWDGSYAFQITTAPCSANPKVVSFVYAHEVGHIIRGHYADFLGSFLYGFYTRREAEADALAFAYLYAISPNSPCGKKMNYLALFEAINEVHTDDSEFQWAQRLEDAALVKKLWEQKQEKHRQSEI